MRELLKSSGYKNAYTTVDINDWHLEDLFRESTKKKQTVDLEKLKRLYISLVEVAAFGIDIVVAPGLIPVRQANINAAQHVVAEVGVQLAKDRLVSRHVDDDAGDCRIDFCQGIVSNAPRVETEVVDQIKIAF